MMYIRQLILSAVSTPPAARMNGLRTRVEVVMTPLATTSFYLIEQVCTLAMTSGLLSHSGGLTHDGIHWVISEFLFVEYVLSVRNQNHLI